MVVRRQIAHLRCCLSAALLMPPFLALVIAKIRKFIKILYHLDQKRIKINNQNTLGLESK